MTIFRYFVLFLGLIFLTPFQAGDAAAQATRTWVSGVGDDANPCSRTAPCKTFAGAISKTAAGGEISVLDPGGFGAVTITKSISIVARGDLGSVLVAGTNGIVINAAATDVVTLSGLEINGIGENPSGGLAGVKILGAERVVISDCFIHDFKVAGVSVQPSSAATWVHIDRTTISNATTGVATDATSKAAVAIVSRSTLSANSRAGVESIGATGRTIVSDSVITGSATGFLITNSGKTHSMGNNTVVNNTSNGTLTGTSPLM